MRYINRKLIKLTALVLALLLFLSACGKGTDGDDDRGETSPAPESGSDVQPDDGAQGEFIIPYSSADSFDPFTATTINNRQLTNLLYDTLFKLDTAYTAQPNLAESFTRDGAAVTVTLRGDVTFTDGTPLTATDVAHSFNRAKGSVNYRVQLETVSSVSVVDDRTVSFAVAGDDAYAENLLNFPVMKGGSGAGTGRYTAERTDAGLVLNANEGWWGGSVAIKQIKTADLQSNESAVQAVGNRQITFLYQDFGDGSYRVLGTGMLPIQLNNIVYLGVNSTGGVLSNASVRAALSYAIDTGAVASDAYKGYALAASTPFNPAWNTLEQTGTNEEIYSVGHAAELLSGQGFTSFDDGGARTDGTSSLRFDLIVNKDNTFKKNAARVVADQLSQAGVKINVIECTWDEYTGALSRGDYDLYIGEVKLKNNMELSPLLTAGGAASYGQVFPNGASEAYRRFREGGIGLGDFVAAFRSDMPFIPLCYRMGAAAYLRDLSGTINSTDADIYYNIQDWSM